MSSNHSQVSEYLSYVQVSQIITQTTSKDFLQCHNCEQTQIPTGQLSAGRGASGFSCQAAPNAKHQWHLLEDVVIWM